MAIVDFFQGILNFLSYIWNTINGAIHILQSIFNLFSSVFSAIASMVQSFYTFTPFITVPISVIGVVIIIAIALGIIKKLPIM